MQARIESALTLEEVAEHFEQWRGNKNKGDRIPEKLWSEALGLVSAYGVPRVARTLRLGGQDLNKRRGIYKSNARKAAPSAETAFVELDPVVRDLLGQITSEHNVDLSATPQRHRFAQPLRRLRMPSAMREARLEQHLARPVHHHPPVRMPEAIDWAMFEER